jgi:hypothetical protein
LTETALLLPALRSAKAPAWPEKFNVSEPTNPLSEPPSKVALVEPS